MMQSADAEWIGDIAQLGERLNGIQEAVGSSPIISMMRPLNSQGSFFYVYSADGGMLFCPFRPAQKADKGGRFSYWIVF